MSKHKVGDKVWLIREKKYAIITKHNIEYLDAYKTTKGDFGYSMKGYDNIWAFYPETDFHETFETMIARLGFGDEGFLKNHFYNGCGDTCHLYYGKKDTKYDNYRIFIFNNFYVINRFDFDSNAKIDKPLHEALTQLMRELKANE